MYCRSDHQNSFNTLERKISGKRMSAIFTQKHLLLTCVVLMWNGKFEFTLLGMVRIYRFKERDFTIEINTRL